jgi:hypothetical protein
MEELSFAFYRLKLDPVFPARNLFDGFQSAKLTALRGGMGYQWGEMHKTDNNPYDPGVGIEADIDFLPLKEFSTLSYERHISTPKTTNHFL